MRHHLAPHPAPLRNTPPRQVSSADPCSATRNPPPVGRPGNVQSIAQMSIASAPRWLCGDGYSPGKGCHGLSSACRANSKASRAPPTSNQVHRQPQSNPRRTKHLPAPSTYILGALRPIQRGNDTQGIACRVWSFSSWTAASPNRRPYMRRLWLSAGVRCSHFAGARRCGEPPVHRPSARGTPAFTPGGRHARHPGAGIQPLRCTATRRLGAAIHAATHVVASAVEDERQATPRTGLTSTVERRAAKATQALLHSLLREKTTNKRHHRAWCHILLFPHGSVDSHDEVFDSIEKFRERKINSCCWSMHSPYLKRKIPRGFLPCFTSVAYVRLSLTGIWCTLSLLMVKVN